MAIFYTTNAGAGAHDGTSLEDAYSWSEFITAYALATLGGDLWYVQDGIAGGTAAQTLSCACPGNNPHVIMGFKTTPGDGDQGYGADGRLNSSNFATLTYSEFSGRLTVSASNTLIAYMNIVGDVSNTVIALTGQGSRLVRSRVENVRAGTNAACISLGHITSKAIDCDFYQSAASGGNPCAVWTAAATYYNCRATSDSGPGWMSTYGFGEVNAINCLAIGCGAAGFFHNTTASGGHMSLYGCDAIECVGDALEIVSSAIGVVSAINCGWTDNDGYAVDANTITSVAVFLHRNRFRDNTAGRLNVSAGHAAAELYPVTADTGGIETDRVNHAAGDDRVLPSSPMADTSSRGSHIGSRGVQPVTADGGMKGYGSA
jgi:hypothetical protein